MTEKEFAKHLKKVMRRRSNNCSEWVEYDFEENWIKLRSLIRGNEWKITIDEFLLINK